MKELLKIKFNFALHCPVYNQYRTEFVDICRDRIVGWDILTDIGKVSSLFDKQPRLFGKYLKNVFLHPKSLLYK